MREIKFRAWRKYYHEKYCPKGGYWLNEQNDPPLIDLNGWFYSECDGSCREYNKEEMGEVIIEQYTGIKDKNGKEMDWWENDKLMATDGSNKVGVIRYSSEFGGYYVYDIDTDFCLGTILWAISKNWRKVGNIHED